MSPNYAINSDNKKRRAFVAPIFIAGYGERYVKKIQKMRESYKKRS